MAQAPHFDLTSFLDLQKKYAMDLSSITTSQNYNDQQQPIIDLSNRLNTVNDNLNSSQAASQSVIFKQRFVNDILDTENQRLIAKRDNIDTAISGQRRMIALNNNYQKRYSAYTKIAIAITVGAVLYIFMEKLKILLPFIPEIVFYLIIIVILGIIIIYIIVLYMDISRRELTNFDEIQINTTNVPAGAPTASSDSTAASATSATASGSSTAVGSCTDAVCCGTGTSFDKASNTCIKS